MGGRDDGSKKRRQNHGGKREKKLIERPGLEKKKTQTKPLGGDKKPGNRRDKAGNQAVRKPRARQGKGKGKRDTGAKKK